MLLLVVIIIHTYLFILHSDSAEARIKSMMPLYRFFRFMVAVPRLKNEKNTLEGMNFNWVEELLTGTQARCILYAMTPKTGLYHV